MTRTQEDVIKWHLNNGGHPARLAGHALRLLCEAVELCVVAGAGADEIGARVGAEIAKQAQQMDFGRKVTLTGVLAELVDVQLLGDVLAYWTGGTVTEIARADKIAVLNDRKWEVDQDGVLWRPGLVPAGLGVAR